MHGVEMRPRVDMRIAIALASWILASTVCAQGLVINEFMADNATTRTNAQGQAADWIEIYNASGTATNVGGWYLTDRAGDLRKWRFPSAPIGAYGYLLVYASGSGSSVVGGELHANFKLDADGEYLALVKSDGVTVASEYSPFFPGQTPDVSFGLRPDTQTSTRSGPGWRAARTYLPFKC